VDSLSAQSNHGARHLQLVKRGLKYFKHNIGCISESGDFKNVMNSKLLHLFGFNTYEYSVNIKAFGFSQLTH
jgi:hypothetical protein